jgi:hypothetical protein
MFAHDRARQADLAQTTPSSDRRIPSRNATLIGALFGASSPTSANCRSYCGCLHNYLCLDQTMNYHVRFLSIAEVHSQPSLAGSVVIDQKRASD